MEKWDRYFKETSSFITGLVLIIIGIVLFVLHDQFYFLIVDLLIFLFLLIGMKDFLFYFFKPEKRKSKNFWNSLLHLILAFILSLYPNIPHSFLPWLIGIYFLILSLLQAVDLGILILNQASGKYLKLISFSIYFGFSIFLLFYPLKNLNLYLKILGIYLLLLGLRFVADAIFIMIPHRYVNRLKRRIRITLPVAIECFIPYVILNEINETLRVGSKKIVYEQKKNSENADMEIFVHVCPHGVNRMGHVDIHFNGEVISYGNYDSSSTKFFEFFGDGVIFITKKEPYIPFCIEHSKKTLFVFGVKLTERQKQRIAMEIQKIKSQLVRWYSPLEIAEQKGLPDEGFKDYASCLHRKTNAKFYKFTKGKYRTFFVLGNNCCLLADQIIGKGGTDLLKINGLITPGTYYEYLNREFMRKNSFIVSRSIYNDKRKMNKRSRKNMKENIFHVKKEGEILSFLEEVGYSRKKAKSLLKYDNVEVNGAVVHHFNHPLKIEDRVVITNQRKISVPFSILYEDDEFLVIDKKEKLLTVSNHSSERSLYQLARRYLELKQSREKLFVVHRLDKETSGVVLFCKKQDLTSSLQEHWNQLVKKRIYTAVVSGNLQEKQGTLIFYIQEQGERPVLITDSKHGKKAVTKYRVKRENAKYSLLELEIETGRKNQIRASLAHIAHPVVGDKKYYSKENPIQRVALVANYLELEHPITHQIYRFQTEVPKSFQKLVKK